MFDRSQPMVLYVADDSGLVSRLDLRSPTPAVGIFSRRDRSLQSSDAEGSWRSGLLSIKALTQFSDPNFMLVGGNFGRILYFSLYLSISRLFVLVLSL